MTILSTQPQVDQLDSFIIESTRDVFSTMLSWEVNEVPLESNGQPATFAMLEYTGCIGLAGKMTGSLFFSCSEQLAKRAAGVILGADVASDPHQISDVVGELTNMLAGGCKSRLCDHECPVVMSIPNIIRGNAIRASSRDVKFMLQRRFDVTIVGESFQVIALGKFE